MHIAVASPWEDLVRRDDSDRIERVRWNFPDGVNSGDTVVTIVDAREWTVTAVSVRWVPADGVPTLHRVYPHIWDGISMTALEARLGMTLPHEPTTLEPTMAQRLQSAVDDEIGRPTRWYQLPNRCDDADLDRIADTTSLWGCNACGRDRDAEFTPRFQRHVLTSGDEWPDAVGVCPSCHDILHQPSGPTFDELMYSNRPSCPACEAHQTLILMMGMPPGPPPRGTVLGGCVLTGPSFPQFVCGACKHEW
ncbi:hypothetical protein [Williamsia sp.]|uniref:hypothetical protein n=1 Tax=Williamsia sp. TaxID=1872085 RepID=UPI001A26E8CE|nr:hypothetical protein [Williamsia sp.]MBJ7291578.1 hypothetical protein [Williamsia sp.]